MKNYMNFYVEINLHTPYVPISCLCYTLTKYLKPMWLYRLIHLRLYIYIYDNFLVVIENYILHGQNVVSTFSLLFEHINVFRCELCLIIRLSIQF